MAKPNQHEGAWRRAKTDAGVVYGSTAFQVGSSLVTIGATAAAVATVAGSSEPVQTQIAVPILAAVIAVMVCFLAVFAVQLVVAPIRQRDELREAGASSDVHPVNPKIALRNQLRKGDEMAKTFRRNRGYTSADTAKAEEWTERVVELLAAHASEREASEFIDASRDEANFVHQMEIKVAKLDEIINEQD
jgi:hypothetical protein